VKIRAAWALPWLAVLAAACASREGTGIIVEVDAIPTVKARIDSVRVQVWNGAGGRPVVDESFVVVDGPVPRLPVRLGLRPADPKRASTLRIEATGLQGVDRQQRAVAGSTVTFRPSEVMHVQLVLGAVCPAGCPPEQTCGVAGACVLVAGGKPPAPATDAAPPIDPGGPDAGADAQVPDAETGDDARAESDAAPP
jgi:hypothetical protein